MSGCASRPAIGVLCCNEVSDRPIQAVASRFVEPLARLSGAVVLLIPAVIDACDAIALASRLDGLLLTGSRSNVASRHYGGAGDDAGPIDPARDEVALAVAGGMIDAGKPVFGICRGMQEINVLFGGSLSASIPGDRHHHGEGAADYAALFDHRHDVTLTEGGRLATATGRRRLTVNSVHHQAIDRLGSGLKVEAVADDGLIEAIVARPCGADVLGVQWHPEWNVGDCAGKRAFFSLVGSSLRDAA